MEKIIIKYLVVIFVLIIWGCSSWTSMPKVGDTDQIKNTDGFVVKTQSLDEIENNIKDNTAVLFNAYIQKGNEVTVHLYDKELKLTKDSNGEWHCQGTNFPIILISTCKVGTIDHFILGALDPNLAVCDYTLSINSLFWRGLDKANLGNFLDWNSDEITKACYAVGDFLPKTNYQIVVDSDIAGVEIYFYPLTNDGKIDTDKYGFVLWNYFDLYNPNGAGKIAKIKMVKE